MKNVIKPLLALSALAFAGSCFAQDSKYLDNYEIRMNVGQTLELPRNTSLDSKYALGINRGNEYVQYDMISHRLTATKSGVSLLGCYDTINDTYYRTLEVIVSDAVNHPDPIPCDILTSFDEIVLKIGDTVDFGVSVFPADADPAWEYFSTDMNVLVNVTNSTFIAKTGGSTILTFRHAQMFTAPEKQVKVTVLGNRIPVDVKLPYSSIVMMKGETTLVPVTVMPLDAAAQLTFSTTNPLVASVSTTGAVSALGVGSTELSVTASSYGVEITRTMTIDIYESTNSSAIMATIDRNILKLGENAQIAVSNVRDIASSTISYTSRNSIIATVSNTGAVSAVGIGIAEILVSDGTSTTTVYLRVDATSIAPESIRIQETLTLAQQESYQLTPYILPANTTDKTVIYTSSDAAVATVSQEGIITGISQGTAVIHAAMATNPSVSTTVLVTIYGVIAPTSIIITPATCQISLNETVQLSYAITPADAYIRSVNFESSNPAIATVDQTGKVNAVAAGNCVITATVNGSSIKATANITVVPALTGVFLDPSITDSLVYVGQTASIVCRFFPTTISALPEIVSYTSSDPTVATVSATGIITGITPGIATITIVDKNNLSATLTVSVADIKVTALIFTETSHSMQMGDSRQTTIVTVPSAAGTPVITYTSSDNTVATVSSTGVITALKGGQAVITAATADLVTASVVINVIGGGEFTSTITKSQLAIGDTAQVMPQLVGWKTLRFESSNNSIASVNSLGVVTAVGIGSATIMVYSGSMSSFVHLSVVAKIPAIETITIKNSGYTIEINFDQPVELYEGIEKDFLIAFLSSLKAGNTYTVSKVTAKEGDPNTLILTMETPVPNNNIAVQYKSGKVFAAAVTALDSAEMQASVYPNPADNMMNIHAEGLQTVKLYSLDGKLLQEQVAAGDQLQISLQGLTQGMYMLTIISANGTTSTVVEKK